MRLNKYLEENLQLEILRKEEKPRIHKLWFILSS